VIDRSICHGANAFTIEQGKEALRIHALITVQARYMAQIKKKTLQSSYLWVDEKYYLEKSGAKKAEQLDTGSEARIVS
jgi:hypothetical protein